MRAAHKALELQRKAGGFNRAQALAAAAFVEVSVAGMGDATVLRERRVKAMELWKMEDCY